MEKIVYRGCKMNSLNIVNIVKTNETKIESLGTGFLIYNSRFILTCYHILKKANCYNIGNRVEIKFEGSDRSFKSTLVKLSDKIDAAILYVDRSDISVCKKGYCLSCCRVIGETYSTMGFPDGSFIGAIAHPVFERISPEKLIELKNANEICHGFSGAPLINKSGRVVGMIKTVPQSIREKGSMLYVATAIPIEVITEKFSDMLSNAMQNDVDENTNVIPENPAVDYKSKFSIINNGNIGPQKNVNIETLNGDIVL